MESPEDKKARKRSHTIVCITVFFTTTGFSIILGGVWPYLQELVPGVTKDKLGPVIAANPIAAVITSPIMGIWGNHLGSVRIPCLVTVSFYIIGSLMYGLLHMFGDYAYSGMLISRVLTGIASANTTLCRTYMTQSSTMEERTSCFTYISMAQALGYVLGPGIQALSSIIFPDVIDVPPRTGFHLDMYTFAAFIATGFGVVNFVLLMPYIFQEFNILQRGINEKNNAVVKLPSPDLPVIAAIIFGFFSTQFSMTIIETIATPMVMDQYGWDRAYAVVTVGLVISSGGLLLIIMFVVLSRLFKKHDERNILFFLGLLPIIIGVFLFIPYFGEKTPIQTQCYKHTSVINESSSSVTTVESSELINPVRKFYNDSKLHLLDTEISGKQYTNDDSVVKKVNNTDFFCSENYECACGCPAEVQPWCKDAIAEPPILLLIAFFIVMFGFPACQAVLQGLWSKIAGPRPQGAWMAFITIIGSSARALGPMYVVNVYTVAGQGVTFGVIAVVLIISTLALLLVYNRLIAMKPIENDNNYEL